MLVDFSHATHALAVMPRILRIDMHRILRVDMHRMLRTRYLPAGWYEHSYTPSVPGL
jgi:ABC-type ATPase with predicted acetyltransferase domain